MKLLFDWLGERYGPWPCYVRAFFITIPQIGFLQQFSAIFVFTACKKLSFYRDIQAFNSYRIFFISSLIPV